VCVALCSLQLSDTVLFLRNENGFYEAVNRNLPHRYLALEQKGQFEPLGPAVIGTIWNIDEHTAANKPGQNPYKLAEGTKFHSLFADNFMAVTAPLVPLKPPA
jgi:hypothetical protein